MSDKTPTTGRTPATPSSSVRAIVSLFEKENSGSSDGKDKDVGRGRRGGFLGRSLASRAPTSPASPATPTPSPRWPPSNVRTVPVTTPPPSVKAVDKLDKIDKPGTGKEETTKETSITTSSHPSQPSSPAEPVLPPRRASPVRTSNVVPAPASLTTTLPTESHTLPATPTAPIWSDQQGSEVIPKRSRPAPLNSSTSLPAMPSPIPDTPMTPGPTPHAQTFTPTYTPEDYSLELMQFQAYYGLPAQRTVDRDSQSTHDDEQGRSTRGQAREHGRDGKSDEDDSERADHSADDRADDNAGEQERYPVHYRDPREVDAFWTPVRQYLYITDEELYDS